MLELFDTVADHPLVRMVSLMDHSPGVGQYADIDFYRALRRRGGLDDAYIERRILELQEQRERTRIPNRRALLDRVAGRDIALASHDDRTEEEIAENAADGIDDQRIPGHHGSGAGGEGGGHAGDRRRTEHRARRLAFRQCRGRGSAARAARSMRSPPTTCRTAWWRRRSSVRQRIGLPQAVAMVTDQPARMAGLHDRGRLEPGQRADLVRVALHEDCRWCGRSGAPASAWPDGPDARVAVYYAPQPDDPLYRRGVHLARPRSDERCAGAAAGLADIAEVTAEPRLYGFHATLKPPMRLAGRCRLGGYRCGRHSAR